MVVKEFYRKREDGANLYKSYSDQGFYIKQVETGNIYAEAIDVEWCIYIYEETDIPINPEVETNIEPTEEEEINENEAE